MTNEKTISEFAEGDAIEGFYALRDANLSTTAAGKPYIRLVVADKTGTVPGNVWDATPELFRSLTVNGVVKIRATVETYRGALQIRVSKIRTAAEGEADPQQLLPVTPADLEALERDLDALLASVFDPDYARLLRAFFDDPAFRKGFFHAPAAKENHHAYLGGLAEHTLSLCRIAEAFCQATTTPLNRDLLLAGTLLHDVGKIEELGTGASIEYTDRGKLLGHLIIGTIWVEERAAGLADFPAEKKHLVQHLILSHHGRFEYGSPVLPKTPEALALHHIDNLDAKTVAARRLIDGDAGGASNWTARSWMLETQLYKGPGMEVPVDPSDEGTGSVAQPGLF